MFKAALYLNPFSISPLFSLVCVSVKAKSTPNVSVYFVTLVLFYQSRLDDLKKKKDSRAVSLKLYRCVFLCVGAMFTLFLCISGRFHKKTGFVG